MAEVGFFHPYSQHHIFRIPSITNDKVNGRLGNQHSGFISRGERQVDSYNFFIQGWRVYLKYSINSCIINVGLFHQQEPISKTYILNTKVVSFSCEDPCLIYRVIIAKVSIVHKHRIKEVLIIVTSRVCTFLICQSTVLDCAV